MVEVLLVSNKNKDDVDKIIDIKSGFNSAILNFFFRNAPAIYASRLMVTPAKSEFSKNSFMVFPLIFLNHPLSRFSRCHSYRNKTNKRNNSHGN